MIHRWTFPLLAALFAAAGAHAQDIPGSPYRSMQDRVIKALSQDEVDGLLGGEGMAMALAAELNGHPGPRHVLELSDSLGLSDAQRERTAALFDDMNARARAIGRQIVDEERNLDVMFAAGAPDPSGMIELTVLIGQLRGQLRAEHLRAHLAMDVILDEHQVMRYRQLRGYGHAGHVH